LGSSLIRSSSTSKISFQIAFDFFFYNTFIIMQQAQLAWIQCPNLQLPSMTTAGLQQNGRIDERESDRPNLISQF
jgi:hypothetical protein